MSVSDSLKPSRRNGPFSRVGRVDELLLGGELARVGGQRPHGVERRVRRGNVAAGRVGHSTWRARATTSAAVEGLARVVDLEVAEAEVVEGLEGLVAGALDVRVAQVGGLGAAGGRHGPSGSSR